MVEGLVVGCFVALGPLVCQVVLNGIFGFVGFCACVDSC